MPDPRVQSPPFETLASSLKVIASTTRLEILHALRTRRALHEIRVSPSNRGESGSPDRSLARQTVTHHLQRLVEAGLVNRFPSASDGASDRYALSHERLFAVVDEIRMLAKLTPLERERDTPGETIERPDARRAPLPEPPRLLVAYGRDDGIAHALSTEDGATVTIGRAESCGFRLDYDPFLSAEHCRIEREGSGFVLRDLGSRNGTFVNWAPVTPAAPRNLSCGDLITVGRSVLVLQLSASRP